MTGLTWADFFKMVEDEANKGRTLEKIIPEKVFQALRTLEQNESYKWNEVLMKFQINPDSDNPNVLELPDDFKSLIALNISTSGFEECLDSLEGLDPHTFSFSKKASPSGFWIQNDKVLWLNSVPEETLDGCLWYNRITQRDELIPENSHPILTYGTQALLGMTMQLLAAYCREPSWFDSYGRLTEMGLKTMHIADAELRRASETGVFGGGY